MQGLHDELLAGAGFPGDQDGGLEVRELFQDGEDLAHLPTLADHVAVLAPPFQASFELVQPGDVPYHQHGAGEVALVIKERRGGEGGHLPLPDSAGALGDEAAYRLAAFQHLAQGLDAWRLGPFLEQGVKPHPLDHILGSGAEGKTGRCCI